MSPLSAGRPPTISFSGHGAARWELLHSSGLSRAPRGGRGAALPGHTTAIRRAAPGSRRRRGRDVFGASKWDITCREKENEDAVV